MRKTKFDKYYDIIVAVLLVTLLLTVLYPLYFVVIASISDPSLVSTGKVALYPRGITFEGYKKVIEYKKIWSGYRNTIFYVIGYTILSVSMTMAAGYAVSRKGLVGRNGIMLFMTFIKR